MIVIWSNNIRSVLKPENYFRLNWALKEEKPEVVLLQETWLSKEKHFAIEGYSIHRRDQHHQVRSSRARHSGQK